MPGTAASGGHQQGSKWTAPPHHPALPVVPGQPTMSAISVREPEFAARAARVLDLHAGIWDGAGSGWGA